MSKPSIASCIAIVGLFGGALAQAQQPAQPGQTPTQGAPTQAQDPRPATSQTEGTAADRTPPARTPTTQNAQNAAQSELLGATVVSPSDAPLGKVVDVVFDAKNQPAFVVISSGGASTAVPFKVANSMMSADKIVIDQSRLKAAPAARYWDRG